MTKSNIWEKYDSLLADLDGVVYEGGLAIEPAPAVINALQARGIPVGYVTNNSSRRPETVAEQLQGFGIDAQPSQIIGSAAAGVELLAQLIPAGSRVLVVGGDGLRSAVEGAGFELVPDSTFHPAGVIQGFAPDVSWKNLAEAAYSIQNGAKWVATNQDWTIPQERGLAPGNGTLVSAVHTAVGILPPIAGKPEPAIFDVAVRKLNLKNPIFVGDRLDTDIAGANRAGMASAVVMTGVCTRKELLGAKPNERPRYIISTMDELLAPYKEPKPTKRGYKCGGATVELLGNKVLVVEGDPRSIEALRAAAATIYGSTTPIFGLDVEVALYE